MFYKRLAIELVYFLTCSGVCYYFHNYFSSESVTEKYRLTDKHPYRILYFYLSCILSVFTFRFIVIYIYEYVKSKQVEKEIELRKQNIGLDQLEMGKHYGTSATEPFTKSTVQYMKKEGLGLSTKGTKLKNSHKQKMSTRIMNKLTPKSLQKGPKTNDRFDKNDDLNNSNTHRSYNTPKPERKTVDVHTPQARRKLLDKQVPKQSTNESVVDGVPVRSVKEIIAELHTPKSIKREYTGGYINR